jgi:hypothetical protein
MDTSVRKRRSRNRVEPLDERIDLTDRDRRVFAALDRHGPLPTPILFEFWRGDADGYYGYFQNRMTQLANEQMEGVPYLARPIELNPPSGSKSEPIWYDLTSLSRLELSEKGLLSQHYPARKDKMQHRAMGACVGASIELAAREYGIRYISGEEMLAHANCPDATRLSKNPLRIALSSGKLEPDAIFGLQYPSAGYRFFAREDDRGTESYARADEMQTSLKEKLDKYTELMRTGAYRTWLGVSSFRVMFVTTQPGRVNTIRQRYLKGHPYADLFLLKAVAPKEQGEPSFGVDWYAPRAPLEDLFGSWQTGDKPFDISKA